MEIPQICQAFTVNKKPCKKKSKKGFCFCNTHLPASSSSSTSTLSTKFLKDDAENLNEKDPVVPCEKIRKEPLKKSNSGGGGGIREVEIKEIRGIPYYIDKNGYIYKHEEIQEENPSVIGRFQLNGSIEFIK